MKLTNKERIMVKGSINQLQLAMIVDGDPKRELELARAMLTTVIAMQEGKAVPSAPEKTPSK